MAEEILCSIDEGVATITLNRPEKRNAMNTAVLEGLEHYFDELEDQHRGSHDHRPAVRARHFVPVWTCGS